MGVSTLVGLTQSLGQSLVSSNLSQIEGSLQSTAAEVSWLTTAYFGTAIWASLLLIKFRFQFGLRVFATVGLLGFVAVSVLHLLTNTLESAIAVRAALGLCAAPLTTLTILYMAQAFPPRLAPVALMLAFAPLQLGSPLSRVVATHLLDYGQWHGLYLIDVALAMLCFAMIHLVRLPVSPRKQAFHLHDLISFPFYAAGLTLMAIVLTQGRTAWWTDMSWLGTCLACSLACLGVYAVYDLRRSQPLIDLRWLSTPYMLRYIAAIVLFRVALSEQTVGVVGLMTVLGQTNEQMQTLFALVTVGTIAGFVVSIPVGIYGRPYLQGALAAALITMAALMDAGSTSATRPADLYVSQTLMAFALAAYIASASVMGLGPVLKEGGTHLVDFVAAFGFAQYFGSMLGLAWINSAAELRRQWHYDALAQHISLDNPDVVQRIGQLAGAVARVVGDPVARAKQGVSLFVQQVNREATVLAYIDIFHYIAALGAVMVLLISFVGWRTERLARAAS